MMGALFCLYYISIVAPPSAETYARRRHLLHTPFTPPQVEEHLSLFAAFKGVPAKDIPAAVDEMVREVGLTEKRKTASKNLSGGCVGWWFGSFLCGGVGVGGGLEFHPARGLAAVSHPTKQNKIG